MTKSPLSARVSRPVPTWARRGILTVLFGATLLAKATEPAPTIENLGQTVKLRILVDKVMQPTTGWITKEWMVKASAEAGFNVFSPRAGFDRPDEVREVAGWCKKHGIFFMPWMRGSLSAPMTDEARGRRMVWANGVEQPLWSPNSDEFWAWTTRYIVGYAKLSTVEPALMGVFLDYENYAPGRVANAYSLSYDDDILAKFAESRKLALPELALDQRRKWLDDQGLSDAFHAFQVAGWRQHCQELRKAVDACNPKFRFCVYPAPGTPFMREAVYPEWGTKTAPLILADACTYGRPSTFTPMDKALSANRATLAARMGVPRTANIPFIYTGGIDPVVRGADPEFCGKNAVMISELTDGYWIFYEGPKYAVDHPAYWKWFARANRAIAAGDYSLWHDPPEERDYWFNRVFKRRLMNLKLDLPTPPPESVKFAPVTFRGLHMLLLPLAKGKEVHIVLHHHPVGKYKSTVNWVARDPAGNELGKGAVPQGKSGPVRIMPKQDGLYLLAVDAGACGWSVAAADVPVGIFTGEKIHMIGGPFRLYFAPPPAVRKFTIRFAGSGAETVRVQLHAPNGEVVADAQTTLGKNTMRIMADVPAGPSGAWCIETGRADKGVLEDNTVRLDSKLVPVLSLSPAQLFRAKP